MELANESREYIITELYLMSPHAGQRYFEGSEEHTSQEPGILLGKPGSYMKHGSHHTWHVDAPRFKGRMGSSCLKQTSKKK